MKWIAAKWVTLTVVVGALAGLGWATLGPGGAQPRSAVLVSDPSCSGPSFCVTSSSAVPALYPGAAASALPVTFHNSMSVPIAVTSLTVSFQNAFPGGCDPAAFSVSGAALSGGSPSATIDFPTAVAVAAGSAAAPGTAVYPGTLALADNGQNQDACKQLALSMSYSASAHYTVPTVTTVTPSPVVSGGSESMRLTAKVAPNVSPAAAGSTPTGTVRFYQCSNATDSSSCTSSLGTAALSQGAASVIWSSLPSTASQVQAVYTPTDPTSFVASQSSTTVPAARQATQLSWAAPNAITYPAKLTDQQLRAKAPGAGTLTYTPAAGTVLHPGTQTLSVKFTPADPTAFAPATSSVQLVVNKATPTVTWGTPSAVTYGTALSATQLSATASVPGTLSYTPGLGTRPAAGTQRLSVAFSPSDATDYKPANGQVTLAVSKAAPTITWPTPSPIAAGAKLSGSQLNATASVPGSFVYSPPAGTVLRPGQVRLSAAFTPTDARDYTAQTAGVQLSVGSAPAPIKPHTAAPTNAPATPQPAPAASHQPPVILKSLQIAIVGQPGIKVQRGIVTVHGTGLMPGSIATIYAHSTPIKLGSARADARGAIAARVSLPAGLQPGGHHIVVQGTARSGAPVLETEAFTVATGDVLGSIGSIPHGPLATLVPFQPSAHLTTVLGVTAGGVAAVGGLAAALGGGAAASTGGSRSGGGTGGGGDGGGGRGSEGAFLEDVELEREMMKKRGRGRGDRSRTWRWPLTRYVDYFSAHIPARVASISPVAGRVAVDGDYLRAMFGGLWLALYPLAIALGFLAAQNTGGQALPPTLGVFLTVLGLSVLDSMAGYLAGLTFAAVVILSGGATDSASIRELCGVVLIWFAVPLAAASMRPLRRNARLHLSGVWDRAADFVLAGLFGGWLAAKMTEGLSPLRGYELELANHKWTIAVFVIVLVGVRMIAESIAAHHYPDRLKLVEHRGELESGNLQVGLSLVVQVALFIYIARAFMGWGWPLFAGTAVFFTPLVPWLFADRLPKSRFVAKWMPLGLAKWSFVILAGILLSKLIEVLVHSATLAEGVGFVFLPLPILICWGLELFEAEDEEEDEEEAAEHGAGAGASPAHEHGTEHPEAEEGRFTMTWKLRLAGVPLTVLCVYLVLSGIATG